MPHDLLFVNSSIIVGWRVEVETVIYVDIFKKIKSRKVRIILFQYAAYGFLSLNAHQRASVFQLTLLNENKHEFQSMTTATKTTALFPKTLRFARFIFDQCACSSLWRNSVFFIPPTYPPTHTCAAHTHTYAQHRHEHRDLKLRFNNRIHSIV